MRGSRWEFCCPSHLSCGLATIQAQAGRWSVPATRVQLRAPVRRSSLRRLTRDILNLGLLHFAGMKWILVIVLAIIGVLAAIVAIEYFVVPIHSLPSFIPGHRHTAGHYRKRGAAAALIAVVALVGCRDTGGSLPPRGRSRSA